MKKEHLESGQALVLIVFGIIGLVSLTALSIDGGNAFEDRRSAQNAADSAALAGALAYVRGYNITNTVVDAATINGYNNDGTRSVINISTAPAPDGVCPGGAEGLEITVDITSNIDTYFAPVIGIRQLTNKVSATSRSCGTFIAPFAYGDAVVGLDPNGTAYSAKGTPQWTITGGGVFSNSNAECSGNAGVDAPSVTAVGTASFSCHNPPDNVQTNQTSAAISWSAFKTMLPPTPNCSGSATQSGSQWHEQAGHEGQGSKVAWTGDMDFAPGVYCVTNSPGPYHGSLTGDGVVFYLLSPTFSLKLNGGGNITATAPTNGPYKGVLIYAAPQSVGNTLLNSQSIDLRGNGSSDVVGTILAPSADITMYGNSGTAGYHSQIIGYDVTSGGNADINIYYQSDENYEAGQPASATLLK